MEDQALDALRELAVTFRNTVGPQIASKHGEFHRAMQVLEAAGYRWRGSHLVKGPVPPCTCSPILPGGGWDFCPRHG